MKGIVDAANDMIQTLKNCSPICSQNYTHYVNYDSFSFEELLTLIMTYRTFKRKYKNNFVCVHIKPDPLCGMLDNIHCYGKDIYIRAYYEGPSPYEYEYDYFLIRYVSEKFDLPLYLVNSYIKMYYFVDYFNHG